MTLSMLWKEILLLSLLSLCFRSFSFFTSTPRYVSLAPGRYEVRMHFEEAILGNTALATGSLPSQRYIATNRFKVRPSSGPKFEKRWADRKSRVAQLEGFRFFTLLKRVAIPGISDYSKDGDFGNYVSLTVWENKDCFDAWRTGDAFKEAHGGGGITDFIQLLTTAIFILDGGPKPAFFDALLPQKGKGGESFLQLANEGGWRKVEADGVNEIPSEIFVAQTRYAIADKDLLPFEQAFNNLRNNKEGDEVGNSDGFVGSFLQRRDATKADDGYNYLMTTIWKDRSGYEAFATSTADGFTIPAASAGKVFYEGKLVLINEKGI